MHSTKILSSELYVSQIPQLNQIVFKKIPWSPRIIMSNYSPVRGYYEFRAVFLGLSSLRMWNSEFSYGYVVSCCLLPSFHSCPSLITTAYVLAFSSTPARLKLVWTETTRLTVIRYKVRVLKDGMIILLSIRCIIAFSARTLLFYCGCSKVCCFFYLFLNFTSWLL